MQKMSICLTGLPKKDTCEINIVTTQVDNQLFDSEKETKQGILSHVLENITQTLTHHKNKTLQSTIEQHLEAQDVLETLKNIKVIHSSGCICMIYYKVLISRVIEIKRKSMLWGNLQESYPNVFPTKAKAMTH